MDSEDNNKSPYNRTSEWTGDASGINPATSEARVKHDNAAATLGAAERNAAGNPSLTENTGREERQSATAAEKATDFINNVAGKAPLPAPAKGALKASGKLKKYGPIGGILALVLTVGIFFFASQGLIGVGLIDRFIDEFNTLGTTSQARSNSIINHLIKKGNIPKGVKNEFKKQGIKVSSKNGVLYLHFKDSKGDKVRVAATSENASKVKKGTISLDDALARYPEFNTRMTAATQRYGGQSSGWYNKYARDFMKFYGINRDSLHASSINDDEAAVQEKIKEKREKMTSTGEGVKKVEEKDKDGNTTGSHAESDGTTSIDTSDEAKLRSQLGDVAKNAGGKVTSVGSAVSNIASGGICINYYTVAGIQAARNAYLITEALNLFSTIAEAVQKTQIGSGSESPMHTIMNMLTKPGKDGKSAMSSPALAMLFSGGKGDQYNNHQVVKDTSLEGLSAQSGGGTVKEYKQCNASRLASSFANVADAISDYAPGIGWAKRGFKLIFGVVITQVASFVISEIVQSQIDSAVKTMMIDVAGDDFYSEYGGEFIEMGGQHEVSERHKYSGGNAFTEKTYGAYQQAREELLAKQADYERSIFSPFDTRSRYTFFGSIANSFTNFATTSSITSTMSQFSSAVSSSLINLLPSVSAKSLTTLNQTVGFCPAAESAGNFGDHDTDGALADMSCLAYIGDVSTTDSATADISMEDLFDYLCIDDNLNECGSSDVDVYKQLSIKTGSKLAQFAAFWNKRESNLGVVDINVAAGRGNGVLTTIADTGIDGVSDIADAINALSENTDENICWSTGGIGVYGSPCQRTYLPELPFFQAFYGWEEFKQNAEMNGSGDFVATDDLDDDSDDEDDTGYEVTADPVQDYLNSKIIAYNPDEDLSDVAVINEYTGEEYDMSYEARFARAAGITKDQAIAWFDALDYYNYIANYDPTNLGPINNTKEDAPTFAGAPEDKQGLLDGIEFGEQIAFVADTRGDSTAESNPIIQRAVAVA